MRIGPINKMIKTCGICDGPGRPIGNKNGFEIQACRDCGTFFVTSLQSPSAYLHIYSDDYFAGASGGHGYADYDRDKQVMIPTFNRYIDIIEKFQPGKGTLVDVGAATGFFLELAVARGWSGIGIEPSAYASAAGRSKGLDVRTTVFDRETLPRASVSVLTLWDVLEHVPDPKGLVDSVHRCLQPGGLVAINTPDAGSLLAKMLGSGWHLVVPPEHLFLFTMRSLRKVLDTAGFEILYEGRIGKTFTVQYVLETLFRWQKLTVWKKGFEAVQGSAVGRAGVPINLHDNMFVLARKL
jgi:SAM-dependent methyltransferase